jgi:uroporphyrinogen decarboxylase
VDFATEVTLQPVDRYPLDAAILFSDILTVPDAMGLGLSFAQGEGPRFARPLRDEAAVAALQVPDLDHLRYVFDAVRSIRQALGGRVPLIGFSGSPWTLACYMVEGSGSDDYRLVKTMLYSRPDLLERVLEVNSKAVVAYLNAQIEAGAQAVMVFDSWGGVLADGAFQRFSLRWIAQVVQGIKRRQGGERVPCIVFTKGGRPWLDEIAAVGADVVGLDWTVNLGLARARVGSRMALQRMRHVRCSTVSATRSALTAGGTGTSSTLDTASASTRHPRTSVPWLRLSTAIPKHNVSTCPDVLGRCR